MKKPLKRDHASICKSIQRESINSLLGRRSMKEIELYLPIWKEWSQLPIAHTNPSIKFLVMN